MSVRGPLGATPQSAGFDLSPGAIGTREAASSRRGLFGLAGLLLCGLLIAVSAAGTDPLLPESIRPVPASMAGAFASAGLNLHWGGVMIVLTLMFGSYMIVVAAAGQLSGRAVLMAIAGLHALVLLAPPLISTDIFSYQAYARMGALYGTNPYLNGPHAIFLDPVFPYIGARWSYTPSVYGPVFTTLSYILAPLSIAASAVAYKLIAAVSSLGLVALVWNAARLRGINPVKAAALVGLNPLLVMYGVGGGHNDLVMLVVMAGAMYAILANRERLGGGLSILAAVGIKLTSGILLPFAFAAGGPRAGSRRRNLLIGAGAAFGLISSLAFVLFGFGAAKLVVTMQQSQSVGSDYSISGFMVNRLGLSSIGHVVGYLLAAAFAGSAVWLLRRVWRGTMDWIAAAGWATVAMLVSASALMPWYIAWLLPLAALGGDRRLFRVAIGLTGVVQAIQMLGYIPHGGSLVGF